MLVQAAASGLPAMAMEVYRPDFVLNGMTGFLVDSDDELAEKLDLLIRDPHLRVLWDRQRLLTRRNSIGMSLPGNGSKCLKRPQPRGVNTEMWGICRSLEPSCMTHAHLLSVGGLGAR